MCFPPPMRFTAHPAGSRTSTSTTASPRSSFALSSSGVMENGSPLPRLDQFNPDLPERPPLLPLLEAPRPQVHGPPFLHRDDHVRIPCEPAFEVCDRRSRRVVGVRVVEPKDLPSRSREGLRHREGLPRVHAVAQGPARGLGVRRAADTVSPP